VPAVTFNPSDNIAFANCLASISVGNDFVCRGEGAREVAGRHWLGLSTETYPRLVMVVYGTVLAITKQCIGSRGCSTPRPIEEAEPQEVEC